MSIDLIRRYERNPAATAGQNELLVDVFDGEIIASLYMVNINSSCTHMASFEQGGSGDAAIHLIPFQVKHKRGVSMVLYPLGRTRVRKGKIDCDFGLCTAGDEIRVFLGVEMIQ